MLPNVVPTALPDDPPTPMWLPPLASPGIVAPGYDTFWPYPAPLTSTAAPLSIVIESVALSVSVFGAVPFGGATSAAPLLTVSVLAVIDVSETLPVTVTFVAVIGSVSVRNCPATDGPWRFTTPFTPIRIGSRLRIDSPFTARKVSKRYTPCHLSPATMLMVSLPFGASVTVLLFGVIVAMRQVPLSTPAASLTSTQCDAKNAGTFVVRSVTSVAPVLPVCATPLPSEGKSTSCAAPKPLLSIVTSPYVAVALLRNTVPAPPRLPPS